MGRPAAPFPDIMQKQSIFQSKLLPFALVAPQLAIVLIFFYWPAAQAVLQSFLLQDAFGLSTSFVWFENYVDLLKDPAYFDAVVRTFVFSFAIAVFVALLCAAARGDGGQAAARRRASTARC